VRSEDRTPSCMRRQLAPGLPEGSGGCRAADNLNCRAVPNASNIRNGRSEPMQNSARGLRGPGATNPPGMRQVRRRIAPLCEAFLGTAGSFVADHLCAASAVVDVGADLDHAQGARVVGRGDLLCPRASQAADHRDLDGRTLRRVHAVSD